MRMGSQLIDELYSGLFQINITKLKLISYFLNECSYDLLVASLNETLPVTPGGFYVCVKENNI